MLLLLLLLTCLGLEVVVEDLFNILVATVLNGEVNDEEDNDTIFTVFFFDFALLLLLRLMDD